MNRSIPDLTPQRVAITQLGSIRDCLLTVPLAVDVKKLWPQSSVVWLVESEVGKLLENHTSIDQIIRLESGWTRRLRDWRELLRTLRDLKFDLALDPMGLTKSAVLGLAAGANTRIGFAPPLARELAPWFYTHRVTATLRHRSDAHRELLSPWHSPQAGGACYQMPDYSADIDQLIRPHRLESGNWYVIHPGAIWPTGIWPVERFGCIAREIYQRHELRPVIVWLGENERLLSEVVKEDSGGIAVTTPKLSLPEIAELLRQSQFLISGDSTVLQLASSVAVACLSLHGPTWGDETGGYGPNHIAIQSPYPRLARSTLRRGPNTAMQAIEVDEVLFQVQRLLRRLAINRASLLGAA